MFKHSVLCALVFFTGSSFSADEGEERVATPAARPAARRRISSVLEQPAFNPSPEVMEKMNDPQEPFNGYWLKHSIGLEGGLPLGGTGTAPTVLTKPAIAYGVWTSPTSGWEFYFGMNKDADSGTTTTAITKPVSPTTIQTETTTLSNTLVSNPRSFILGAAYKQRIYQVRHFGLSLDFLAFVVPKHSSEFNTNGTITKTTANINTPSNYQVADSYTNKEISYSTAFGVGPRFNVEYNIPYVPHLLIGLTTGIVAKFGGEKTDTSTTVNQTTTYTNGTPGTPSKGGTHGNTSTVVTDPGENTSTYGIIPMAITGTFRIRYAF